MALISGWSAAVRAKRRRCVVALALVVLGAGVGGCNADPPDPGPTWSASASADGTASGSPTAAPGPAVPVLPAAAREASEAGARAFVGYYWELVNYAQATGDVKALRRASAPTCTGCQSGIRGVVDLYEAGGHLTGGTYSLAILTFDQLKGMRASNVAFEALLTVHNLEQLIVRNDGTTETQQPNQSSVAIVVFWTGSRWRLDVMEVRP